MDVKDWSHDMKHVSLLSEQMNCIIKEFRDYMNSHEGCMLPSTMTLANVTSDAFRPCNVSTYGSEYYYHLENMMFARSGSSPSLPMEKCHGNFLINKKFRGNHLLKN